MNHRTAIVYDWHLDIRAGGPTGYLANLKKALEERGDDSIEFIVREDQVATPPQLARVVMEQPGLTSVFDDYKEYKRLAGLEFTNGMLSSLENLGKSRFSPAIEAAILESSADVFHVHTVADAVKLHNLLTLNGLVHKRRIVLMSHTPEIPAREWSNVAFEKCEDARSAEAVFDAHRYLDRLAFTYADSFIFPNAEAVEPYHATWPGFEKDFCHKPVYYVASGVDALAPTTLPDPKAHFGVSDHFVVSFLGRHNAIKGYDMLTSVGLAFLEVHEDASFLIAGKPEPMTPPNHRRWQEIGWTQTPQDVIAASDVFILPNRLTYFDLVLLEVLSTGTIILAANNGGNRSFAGKSDGIFLFDDEDDLCEKLEALKAKSPNDHARLGRANRALYEAEFTADAFAERYAAAARQIEEEARPAPLGTLAKARSKAPEVSVIVPVYNVADYVGACLESILALDFPSFEVIVVDDGSTDGSADVLAGFAKDPRLRIVRTENQGLSEARNTGLQYARGAFLCFVDSDDMVAPDYLSEMHKRLVADETDICVCAITIFGEKLSEYHSTFHEEDAFFSANPGTTFAGTLDNITRMFPSAWNKMYRARVFEDVRYPRGLLYEDNPVHMQLMLQQSRISYVKDALYLHRDDRPSRISKTSSMRMIEIARVVSALYSIIHAATTKEVARNYTARLLQRLFWERFWEVKSEDVNVYLSAALVQLTDLFGLDDAYIAQNRDTVIEAEFLSNKRLFLDNKRAQTGNRFDLSLNDRLKIVDVSVPNEPDETPKDGCVLHKEDGAVVVHPAVGQLTVCEITGFHFFDDIALDLLFALENEAAAGTEVRALLMPERIVDPKRLAAMFDVVVADDTRSAWMDIEPNGTVVASLKSENYGPCTTLYVASRPTGDTADFAWLHLRKIAVSRILEGA